MLKHFQIRFHGTGYDQYDVECPESQVYDLVHFLCIDSCSVGTYQRPPAVSFFIKFKIAEIFSYSLSRLRVWVCHGQNFFFEFIVGLDRVAQDKLFGVGMPLLRPRICPLETV